MRDWSKGIDAIGNVVVVSVGSKLDRKLFVFMSIIVVFMSDNKHKATTHPFWRYPN